MTLYDTPKECCDDNFLPNRPAYAWQCFVASTATPPPSPPPSMTSSASPSVVPTEASSSSPSSQGNAAVPVTYDRNIYEVCAGDAAIVTFNGLHNIVEVTMENYNAGSNSGATVIVEDLYSPPDQITLPSDVHNVSLAAAAGETRYFVCELHPSRGFGTTCTDSIPESPTASPSGAVILGQAADEPGWYMDWSTLVCAMDCGAGDDPRCGGGAESGRARFGTAGECCAASFPADPGYAARCAEASEAGSVPLAQKALSGEASAAARWEVDWQTFSCNRVVGGHAPDSASYDSVEQCCHRSFQDLGHVSSCVVESRRADSGGHAEAAGDAISSPAPAPGKRSAADSLQQVSGNLFGGGKRKKKGRKKKNNNT